MVELHLGVSFLVCSFNGVPRIGETLACLARQEVPDDLGWEVIFVDNASTDGTSSLVRKLWVDLGAPCPLRMSTEPKPGYKMAMELAISQISYRYACIVDDDNRLPANYLRTGVSILEMNPQVGVLGGQNTPTFEGEAPAWFSTFQHCYAVGQPLNRVGGGFASLADGNVGRNVVWGAGMFVKTKVWAQLREAGFKSLFTGRKGEANLTAGEDDELCFAAQLVGYEVWYSSRLHLQHHMTAGRLTEAYRNRLVYASARSANRLNAYRNALWGKQNTAVSLNLLKDVGYGAIGILKNVFSLSFLSAGTTRNSLEFMTQRNVLVQLQESMLHFGRVKKYYEQVLRIKRKVRVLHDAV